MRIQVLGPVRAWRGDDEIDLGSPGQRLMLGLLALACGEPIPQVELIDAIWGAVPPASAANIIQTRIKHLRKLLEPDRPAGAPSAVLRRAGKGYVLQLPPASVDLVRFRELVAAADDPRHTGSPGHAARLLAEALTLWQGAPLTGLPVAAGYPRLVRVVGERRAALLRYSATTIAIGAATDALPLLEEAAATDPLDEAVHAALIRAYHAAGQRAQASAAFHEIRQRLADEFGLQPGAELTAIHTAVLEDDQPDGAAGPIVAGSAAPAVPPRKVPAQLPADTLYFVGRRAQLADLDRWLDPARSEDRAVTAPTVVVVTGTAGVGKTALAVHWAHRFRHRFVDGQLYIDLRGYDVDVPTTSSDALARLLLGLGVPSAEIPLDPDERAARYRTEIAGRRILVLLDNANSAEQVRPLLPGTPTCGVVVTSRDSLAGLVTRYGARRLDVELLQPDEAISLLGHLIGHRAARDAKATVALAEQCARLPLALRIVAEFATAHPTTALTELARELGDEQQRLELLDSGGDPRVAVGVVFSWSYNGLPADTRRVFRLLGVHPCPDIEARACAALASVPVPKARRLLRELARAHLVTVKSGRYGMHDLLRAYARRMNQAEDQAGDRGEALTRLFDHYLGTAASAMDVLHPAERHHRPRIVQPAAGLSPLTDPTTARVWLDAERQNLVAMCSLADEWPQHTVSLSGTLYRHLEGGHYTEALAIHSRALFAAHKSGDARGMAHSLANLGPVCRLMGQYKQATEHFERALALYRENGDRLGEARAQSNLGILDERLGNLSDAVDRYKTALALYRQLGDRHGEASTTNNFAAAYTAMGQHQVAADEYRRAYVLYHEIGDRTGEAIALSNLGSTEQDMGEYDSAADHLQRALVLFRDLGHRYGKAATLNGLGDVQARLGRYREAAGRQREALAIFRELGHRYGEATAANSLGEAELGLGNASGARAHHWSALAVALETGDQDEVSRARAGLARVGGSAEIPHANPTA